MGNGATNEDNQTSFKQWLGRTARITLTDGRVFEGQLMAVDSDHTLLIKYCEFYDCTYGLVLILLIFERGGLRQWIIVPFWQH